jgi:hypothetical protein
MKLFSSLKQHAVNFLEPYKTKEPATYAAAEQAIGAVLIADGLFGISNPLGRNKRRGILGTITGMILGIVFMFIPWFIGTMSDINNMTATGPASVVSVGEMVIDHSANSHGGGTCALTVQYTVDGQNYTKPSPMSSSDFCSLSQGQTITINYDPSNPSAWVYGAEKIKLFGYIFFGAGLLVLISSIITFFIRLFSIIFGWKLLKDGRKNAAMLPPGTNLSTIISEIKQNFTSSIFSFGGVESAITSALTQNQPPAPQPPMNQ